MNKSYLNPLKINVFNKIIYKKRCFRKINHLMKILKNNAMRIYKMRRKSEALI